MEISRQPIPLSTPDNPQEVWGLVTWEDIDPRLTYFSVFVKGLTNAYKPVDLPDGFKPGDPPGNRPGDPGQSAAAQLLATGRHGQRGGGRGPLRGAV